MRTTDELLLALMVSEIIIWLWWIVHHVSLENVDHIYSGSSSRFQNRIIFEAESKCALEAYIEHLLHHVR